MRNGQTARMRPMDAATAAVLAASLAPEDPWARLGRSAAAVKQVLAPSGLPGVHAWCLLAADEPAGALVVRDGWLRGPYLNHLSVLAPSRGQGLAQLALRWWEAEARAAGAGNLWLCVSSFNTPARHLYAKAGFAEVGLIDNLLVDGLDEVLMRKRLPVSS